MWFGLLTLATALIISISAAYYSILGLTAIFAAAFWPIVILGSSLEVGKIVSTLWLHKYWHRAELQYKVYLCTAVAILMVLTSMGVFGFLSKAHTDQSLISGDVIAKISIYDEKIKQSRDNITAARSALSQMDAQVDQVLGRSNDERGAERAVQIRRTQAAERTRLLKEIDIEQKKIQELNTERSPIAAEVRKVEAEVGPIKYIAALIYGDNPEANVLEKAVRWVIILIVIVFDPLALTLLLAATKSIEWERGINIMTPVRRESKYEPDDGPLTDEQLDQLRNTVKDDLPVGKVLNKKSLFDSEIAEFFNRARDRARAIDDGTYKAPEQLESLSAEELHERKAERAWKSLNPDKTLKHQRQLFRAGQIDQLPWMDPEFQKQVLQDTADDKLLGKAGQVKGFGVNFPDTADKGDMFLRVDRLPTVLYKFNGNNWIEVDKQLSDNYAYETAYIDYLIEKIDRGEYDLELLSEAEKDSIEKRLKS